LRIALAKELPEQDRLSVTQRRRIPWPASTAAPKPPELKNSHWCVHPTHGLGMIGEIGAT
jgi:hypothetical protein